MNQHAARTSENGVLLRPASLEEAGLVYSEPDKEQDKSLATVGRVTYVDGTKQEFTDLQQYLRTIREELPYRNTTGFRYETLTESPQVKMAVDDIIMGFAGEENPKRVSDYGLTEKGAQMLRDAADPSLPHTYAWFVLTDYNTAQEQLFCELTLEEAIQIYQNSDTLEKRLGVTKDSIATVDIVHMAGGDQRFFTDYQKLESFRTDPVIYEAVDQLHQELVQSSSAQNMNMGGM